MTKAETQGDPAAGARRVYPLDARDLTEEQIGRGLRHDLPASRAI